MAFPYLEAVVGFTVFMFFFESYLHYRQYRALKLPTLPPTLKGVVSQEKFEKSRAYTLEKSRFGFFHSAFNVIDEVFILLVKALPWMWLKSEAIIVALGFHPKNEIAQTIAFIALTSLWNMIFEMPFSLYSTFVIEERHGFNKQTIWLYIKDMLIGIMLMALLAPPIVAAVITIVERSGPYLAVYLWIFALVVSLVLMVAYPVLIAPLFNKFTPLPEGSLRKQIEDLASSLNFPLKKLFLIDGSIRSNHSNAYMYGFFKSKRIVLYDTLVQQCKNEDEVVAVIAHELGHWKLNHTSYSFIAAQILTLLNCIGYMTVKNSSDLYRSFGFTTQPVLIGLILFQHTVTPLMHLTGLLMNLVSRAFEFQADAFAGKLGYSAPLRGGLIKLQEENLSAMNTDPWYSAYHYSHPPLVERLAALDNLEKKSQ